jgi:2-oxoisovalerate ferredoxin oxidoreductase alpha subunit
MTKVVMSGNSAQAYAAKLAHVDVVAAYPITPQTTIIEKIAEFMAKGELEAQYIKVESEHSALQACISASAVGARTYTATSSQGLLLMHELLHWASGARAPIVMGVANRAVAPPWNIGADHTDTMAQRDTGWIQFYAESNQEVLDTVLQAFRLAEDEEVSLPVMVSEDAFFLTHTVEPVDVPAQGQVDAFLPARKSKYKVGIGKAMRLGSYLAENNYEEYRRKLSLAMERAPRVFGEVEEEFQAKVGRSHGGLLPCYKTEGADAVLITMGTAGTTARAVVDRLREEGKRVGLAKLRAFRPFPVREVLELGKQVGRIGVLDRSFTFAPQGAAATEVQAALYKAPERPQFAGFIAGLGGRDITPEAIDAMYRQLLSGHAPETSWVGLVPSKEVRVGA